MNMNNNYDNKLIRRLVFVALALVACVGLAGGNLSAELTATGAAEPVKVKTLERTEGTVSYVSSSHISVVYKQTENAEYELYPPIDPEVELEYVHDIADLKSGDRVKMEYEKVVESPGKPEERITMTVKKIRLVKKAPKEGES